MRFTKMQGIGNDFVLVNCFEEDVADPSRLAIQMCRPHFGVGADGLVLLEPADGADAGMRIFNSDGSESEMCGNATRCIAKYVHDRGLTDKTEIRLMTGAGIKILKLTVKDGVTETVRVDMGEPELEGAKIPVKVDGNPVLGAPVAALGRQYNMTCVSMGNPHAVIYVDDADSFDVHGVGASIEVNPLFPRKTNVEFVTVKDRTHLRMRVWERGSGETLACGTGACAALVATVLNGLCERKAILELNGGPLTVEWDPVTNHVFQEGPAEFVFDTEYNAWCATYGSYTKQSTGIEHTVSGFGTPNAVYVEVNNKHSLAIQSSGLYGYERTKNRGYFYEIDCAPGSNQGSGYIVVTPSDSSDSLSSLTMYTSDSWLTASRSSSTSNTVTINVASNGAGGTRYGYVELFVNKKYGVRINIRQTAE